MRFQVLGPIEVQGPNGRVSLGGPKQRLVLAHLLIRANHVVPADELIDQVWGEEAPEAARNTLQSYVSHLRKALGADRIEGRPPGYLLRIEPDELDAARFDAMVREARAADGDDDRVASILRDALALWRGPAFADLASEWSLAGEIARLDDARLAALEERIDADLSCGRHAEVIGELQTLTHEHPLRERLWGHLMLGLYRSGRQADALAAYGRAREILVEELGVDPSAALKRLHERILRQDPDLDLRGTPLRGYRLLEKIGEGAFGEVHRALQPQVGRDVAVKVVHPELANQPDFVRRFEREAQLVARLEHPHVVPLYDYWREPDAAYLVMRYLRGGSVADLLEGGPVELPRASAILEQVASALSAAHRQGVVHRDVKPGNVLLDEEGNAYLTDFGVALDAGAPEQTTGTMVRGTPAYLSPEQIRLEPATPRSDIYALGVVLYELLAGGHPFPDSSLAELFDRHLHRPLPSVREVRPELPPAVDAVIARATSKDASIRFGDPMEMAVAFRTAIQDGGHVAAPGAIRNPFKGLRTFLEADAGDFFGREALVRRLVERLAEPYASARFLCVVGPSGSGKSSLVRAGVVPALRRGAIEGSDRWYVVDVMPGSHPLRELESALLGVAVEPPPSLFDDLEHDELGLVHAVERILPDPEAELLIVLDQLEEVFTLADEDERARFLDAIVAAVGAHGSRVRVIATLRADFFDRPLSVRGFGDLLAARSEAITPMSPEELERAISGPAERVGLEIEPGLVAAMVTDVVDRPGALPLLQYALTELAERAIDGHLTIERYREIGRVSGALGRRAEQLFERLNEPGRDACRQLFLRLVTLGEGAEDTRRRVRRSELRSLADERSMDGVIETLGRHRLLSFDRDPATREPTIEIAHESLLTSWSRLATWINEARDDLWTHGTVAASAAEWRAAGRDESFLLRGSRLDNVEEWAATTNFELAPEEADFVEASVERRRAEREAEATRLTRERSLERRSVRRMRTLVAVLAVASLVAAGLTAVAVDRSREAQRRGDEAAVLGLTGAALSYLRTDPSVGLALATHAAALSEDLDQPVPQETVEALHWTLQEAGVQYPVADGPIAAVSGPLGYRGILNLPIATVANLALEHADPSPPADVCERFFGTPTCPDLPERFPADLRAEPVVRAAAGPDALVGTTVTVGGIEEPGFVAEMEAWTEATGITVSFVDPEIHDIGDATEETADIVVVPQPGLLPSLAERHAVMDLGVYLDVDRVRREFPPYLVSLGTVADDGTWPSDTGTLHGVVNGLNMKSLVWYRPDAFERAGYDVPQTWEELLALTERMVADGNSPWCLGLESGTADGWPATDWVEDLLLAGAGPETYDRWTFHEIPFAHPDVRAAFERFGEVVFAPGNLPFGTRGAVAQEIFSSFLQMFEEPASCWLYHFPSFLGNPEASGITDPVETFPFPAPASSDTDAVLGASNIFVAHADRPEIRELMRYLVSREFGSTWFAFDDGFFSANVAFDTGRYSPFWRDEAEVLHDALASNSFRFDASDLMPPTIGNDEFWSAMVRYVSEGPDSLDEILTHLDVAWPTPG